MYTSLVGDGVGASLGPGVPALDGRPPPLLGGVSVFAFVLGGCSDETVAGLFVSPFLGGDLGAGDTTCLGVIVTLGTFGRMS